VAEKIDTSEIETAYQLWRIKTLAELDERHHPVFGLEVVKGMCAMAYGAGYAQALKEIREEFLLHGPRFDTTPPSDATPQD